MFEELISLDKSLLLFFNHQHNPLLDFLMYWASNKWIWIPFYAFLAFRIYKIYPQRFFSVVVFIGITIALSDQLSSSVIKNLVLRLRPCHDPSIASEVHLVNGYCGGTYGFISSHASNAFALFSFLLFLIRNKSRNLLWIVLVWAIVVSYSRIYLGAHFPGDVICGGIVGFILGFVLYKIHHILFEKYFKKIN